MRPSWIAPHLPACWRRQRAARFLLVTACLLPLAGYLGERYRLGLDPQAVRCLPEVRAVLIDRWRRPGHRGDLVAFEARGLAPAFADGTLLVKLQAALPGDAVEVGPEGVRVNGRLAARGLELAARLGRPPAAFARRYRVPEGRFLPLGTAPLSLDGRYYGTVPFARVRGVAFRLF